MRLAAFVLGALAVALPAIWLGLQIGAPAPIEAGALNRHCSGPGVKDAICREWRA